MKKLYLHIGPHKTGSTYIQKQIIENEPALVNCGISYPKEGLVYLGHHKMAELICNNKFDEFEQLHNKLPENCDVLISSENFDRLSLEQIKFLKNAFANYDVEIIFVRRRMDELLVSSWQESIKHGSVKSWSNFCLGELLRPFSSEPLGSIRVLNDYSEVFGLDSIKIIDFDTVQEDGLDLFKVFLESINVDMSGFKFNNERVNSSMNYIQIEILRLLNLLYIERNKTLPYHYLRESFLKYLKNNPDNSVYLSCRAIIESKVVSFCPSESFTLSFLENSLIKSYKDNFINMVSSNKNVKNYTLPDENCVLDVELIDLLNELLDNIESNK